MLRMGDLECKMCIEHRCISTDPQEAFKEFCYSRTYPRMQAQIQSIRHIMVK